MKYDVRWAKREEWNEAMRVVWRTFERFNAEVCTEEGAAYFRRFLFSEELEQAFCEGRYQLMVALDGTRVIGVGSLRNVNHLSLLFVEEAYHLQGVGSAILEVLCAYLRDEGGEHRLTLTASPYAREFYRKLGFVETKAKHYPPGLPVTFMEKVF